MWRLPPRSPSRLPLTQEPPIIGIPDRRRARRYSVVLPVVVSGEDRDRGPFSVRSFTIDASNLGLLFPLRRRVERGDRIRIRVTPEEAAEATEALDVVAEVVRVEDRPPPQAGTYRAVQFLEPSRLPLFPVNL